MQCNVGERDAWLGPITAPRRQPGKALTQDAHERIAGLQQGLPLLLLANAMHEENAQVVGAAARDPGIHDVSGAARIVYIRGGHVERPAAGRAAPISVRAGSD